MNKIKYDCEENDNRIHIVFEETTYSLELEELHFGTSLKKEGMVVIGFKDLQKALNKAGFDIIKIE